MTAQHRVMLANLARRRFWRPYDWHRHQRIRRRGNGREQRKSVKLCIGSEGYMPGKRSNAGIFVVLWRFSIKDEAIIEIMSLLLEQTERERAWCGVFSTTAAPPTSVPLNSKPCRPIKVPSWAALSPCVPTGRKRLPSLD